MLRHAVTVAGGVLLVAGIVVLVSFRAGWVGGVELIIFGALILLSMAIDRRYRRRRVLSHDGFERTAERFIDPSTGKLTEVLYDPSTGERIYRETLDR